MKPIEFHVARGTFTFRLWATLLALAMFATLMALGFWQIDRLHWKTDLIATIKGRMEQLPVDLDLSVIAEDSVPEMDYHPGRASGTFDNAHELYLNAISINDDGGYDVLTPLKMDDGRVLLVNRGWMPYRIKDNPVGDDPQDSLYRPTGTVRIKGILRLPPDKKPSMRPENEPGKNSWYWVDLKAMASAAGVKEFLPYYMEAYDAPHDGAWPVGGQTRLNIPNHHFQYSITWFWLAFILPFIYFASNWRLDKPKKVEEAEKPESDKPA